MTLIEAEELAGAVVGAGAAGPPPTLLDVRWRLEGPPGVEGYRSGHVPGAVFVDLDRDLAGTPGPGGRHPLPSPVVFQAAMRRVGVSGEWPVVVYDDSGGTSAARAWWLLRYFGHPEVRLLDGGLAAWTAAGGALETSAPAVAAGDFTARPGGLPLIDADGAALVAAGGLLLDARSAERYRGDHEPVDPVAGHIPGAVSAPTAGNLDADGRLLPSPMLRQRFAGLGAERAKRIAVYCGSGVTAAHEVLALEIAGYRAGLYAGSWSEWITDPARPVATGPEP